VIVGVGRWPSPATGSKSKRWPSSIDATAMSLPPWRDATIVAYLDEPPFAI
jgi:hypothetical protein